MKFPISQLGQVGLLLTCTLLITSCNKQDEFFEMEEFVAGVDAYCSQAEDANTCLALGTFCQPAFEASENDFEEPIFAACIANRGALPVPSVDDSTDTIADSGDTTVDDGSASTEDPAVEDPIMSIPSIEEALEANCANLSEEYLYVKKQVRVKKGSVQSSAIKGGNGKGNGNGNSSGSSDIGQSQNPKLEYRNPLESLKASKVISKVKVCHHTGNSSAHTIIIACPALKAHIDHHEDYLGACKL